MSFNGKNEIEEHDFTPGDYYCYMIVPDKTDKTKSNNNNIPQTYDHDHGWPGKKKRRKTR